MTALRTGRRLGLLLLAVSVWMAAAPGPAASEPPPEPGGREGADGVFSFVVWGHPRGDDGQPPVHFDEIRQRIRELRPDLLIVTGDAINGQYAEPKDPALLRSDWDRFESGLRELGVPYHLAPGNHDVNDPVTRDVFLERFPAAPYAFTFEGSRFVILDTVGVARQSRGPTRHQPGRPGTWYAGPVPFDAAQLELIRQEAARSHEFEHMFFFFHHSEIWLEATGDWWTQVHPLLVGGTTRAVFSGNPWQGKYRFLERDGIRYIESAVYPTRGAAYVRELPERDWGYSRELDNLQYVRVRGPEVEIRTIAVGALASRGLSVDYWRRVENGLGRSRRLRRAFDRLFPSFGSLAALAALGGGLCLGLGVLLGARLARRRPRTRPG